MLNNYYSLKYRQFKLIGFVPAKYSCFHHLAKHCFLGRIAFFFLIFLIPFQIFCQNKQYYTKTYTTDQGLANNHVTNIIQDKTGALWIATFDGLSRYDGYEFKNYYSYPKDTNSLGVAQLDAMAVDYTNNLWVLARGKILYKFNRKDETFSKFNNKLSRTAELLSQFCLPIDNSGNLCLLSSEGLLKFNPVTYQTEQIPFEDPNLIPEMDRGYMSIDDKGGIWIINRDLVFHFIFHKISNDLTKLKLKEKFTWFAGKNKIILQSNFSFNYSIIHSRTNNRWLTSNYGLLLLDSVSGRFLKYSKKIPENEFSDNQIVKWSDFEDGLHIYYPKSKQLVRINSQSGYVIESFLIDDQGNIWTGSLSAGSEEGLGLQKSILMDKAFHNVILKNKSNENKNSAVFAISKDRTGNIWIGTRDNNYLIEVSPDGILKKGFSIPIKDHSAGISPRAILFDSLDNVWVGYLSDLLVRYSLTRHSTTYYNRTAFFRKELPFIKSFRKLQNSSNGDLWAGGTNGFCKFNPIHEKVSFSDRLPDLGGAVSFYINEKKSECWLGMHGNVKYYKDLKFVKFIEINDNRSDISSFLEYDDSTLWMPLFGGGICKLNTHTFSVDQFTTADGLSNNSAYNIFKDSRANLWISTNKGISRFNPVTKQFWNFGVSDGLLIEEFNGNAAFQAKDGEIIFGGMGGIVHFYPDSIDFHADTVVHDLVIYDFMVSGLPQAFDSAVSEKTEFILQKGQDNFSFNFACIDLKNADKIKYRYCLSGVKNEWIYTDSKHRYLSYANLDPGTYFFIIESSDMRGEWRNRKIISVTIPPSFFQMLLVRIFGLLILASIILLVIVTTFSNLKEKVKKRNEALRNEVNYRGQMNPHFISNVMTSISGFLSRKDEAGANKFLSTSHDLIRKFLYNSENDYVLFRDELDILELYVELENQCREQRIEFETSVDEAIDPDVLRLVPSLIQPLLENSIVHGFKSLNGKVPSLRIKFKYENEHMITCIVEDNGNGRSFEAKTESSKPRKNRSVAIENIRNRLYIHSFLTKRSYNLKYLPGETGGTIAMINIPAKY